MEGHNFRGRGRSKREKGRETRRRARVLWLTIPQSSNVISVRILFPYSLCFSLPYFALLSSFSFPCQPFHSSLPLLLFAIFNRVEPVSFSSRPLLYPFFSRDWSIFDRLLGKYSFNLFKFPQIELSTTRKIKDRKSLIERYKFGMLVQSYIWRNVP